MRDVVPPPDGPLTGGPHAADSAAGPLRWRVNPALPGLKLTGAVGMLLLGLLYADDPVRITLTAAAVLAMAGWAARDLIAPVRVSADAAGVTVVSGYAGRRTVPWEHVERIRVDSRPRLGVRTETLEIDMGESLHLFGAYDLGASPAEVAARLEQVRLEHVRPEHVQTPHQAG